MFMRAPWWRATMQGTGHSTIPTSCASAPSRLDTVAVTCARYSLTSVALFSLDTGLSQRFGRRRTVLEDLQSSQFDALTAWCKYDL